MAMPKVLFGVLAMLLAGTAWAASPHVVTLQVENMTCPACAVTIERALDKVDGVSAVKVDSDAGKVEVTIDSERVTEAQVAVAVTNAGFPARVAGR